MIFICITCVLNFVETVLWKSQGDLNGDVDGRVFLLRQLLKLMHSERLGLASGTISVMKTGENSIERDCPFDNNCRNYCIISHYRSMPPVYYPLYYTTKSGVYVCRRTKHLPHYNLCPTFRRRVGDN